MNRHSTGRWPLSRNGCGVDIRQRIGELVATRVAEALGGDAGEQVAAAIAKAAGKPKWKRGGKGRVTSGGPRRSGSRAPSAAENTGDQNAATETPAPTEVAADGVNGSGTGTGTDAGRTSLRPKRTRLAAMTPQAATPARRRRAPTAARTRRPERRAASKRPSRPP